MLDWHIIAIIYLLHITYVQFFFIFSNLYTICITMLDILHHYIEYLKS